MIDAKPCYCGDYLMRSHAERTFAGMLDALGVEWVYEPELFNTDAGLYLPDFFLPRAGLFVEVKGGFPSATEIEKAEALRAETGYPVAFLFGAGTKPMVFDGLLLPVGMMAMVKRAGKWSAIPVNALGELIYGAIGQAYGLAFAIASAPRAGDDACVIADRNELEGVMRRRNGPLNRAKLERHRPAFRCEAAIAEVIGSI